MERINELTEEIDKDRQQLENLKKNINLLKNDNLSETDKKIIEKQMIDALEQAQNDKEAHQLWLKERDEKYASFSRKKSIALMKTPKKDDQTPSTPTKTNTPSSIVTTPVSNQPPAPPSSGEDLSNETTTTTAQTAVTTPSEEQQQFTVKQEKLTAQELNEQATTRLTREKSKDADKVQIIVINEDKRQSIDKPAELVTKDDRESSDDKPAKDKVVALTSKVSDKIEITVVQPVVHMEVDNVETTSQKNANLKSTADDKERTTTIDKDEIREEQNKEQNESIASNKRKRTSTSISLSSSSSTNSPAIQQQTTPSTQTRRSGRFKPLRQSTISKTEQSAAAAAVEQSQSQLPSAKKTATTSAADELTPVLTVAPINASQLILNDDSTKDSTTSDLTDTYTSPNSPASSILNIDPNDPEQVKEQKEYKTWKKSILLLWREIATHKYSTLFASPVTDEEANGYSTVVLRPIDLTMIKRKIENGQFRTTAEFQRDIMLMFQNAIMYNSVQHEVHQMTVEMQRDVLESIEDFISNQKSSSSTASKENLSSRRKSRTM